MGNNQIIVPHLIYLFNLLIKNRCGTIRSIPTYDRFDIESNLETQESGAAWENIS